MAYTEEQRRQLLIRNNLDPEEFELDDALQLRRKVEPLEEEPSNAGSFARSAALNVTPALAGTKAGLATTAASAPVLGPFAVIPGLVAGAGVGLATRFAQDKALESLGVPVSETVRRDREVNPYASLAGDIIGGGAGGIVRGGAIPSIANIGKAGKTAVDVAQGRAVNEAARQNLGNVVIGGAIDGSLEAGIQIANEQDINFGQIGLATLGGATFNRSRGPATTVEPTTITDPSRILPQRTQSTIDEIDPQARVQPATEPLQLEQYTPSTIAEAAQTAIDSRLTKTVELPEGRFTFEEFQNISAEAYNKQVDELSESILQNTDSKLAERLTADLEDSKNFTRRLQDEELRPRISDQEDLSRSHAEMFGEDLLPTQYDDLLSSQESPRKVFDKADLAIAEGIKIKLGSSKAGFFDASIFEDVSRLGTKLIAAGYNNFKSFAGKLISTFGNGVMPYIQRAWDFVKGSGNVSASNPPTRITSQPRSSTPNPLVRNKVTSKFASVLDRVASRGDESGRVLYKAADAFLLDQSSLLGKYYEVPMIEVRKVLRETLGTGENVMSHLTGSLKGSDNVLNYLYRRSDGLPLPSLSPQEKKAVDIISEQLIKQVRADQNARGILINDERFGNFNEKYFPHMLGAQARDAFVQGRAYKDYDRLRDAQIKYLVQNNKTKDEAVKEVDSFIKSFGNPSESINTAAKFGPIDESQGVGLAPELRETNLQRALHRYAQRVSRRFAYHEHFQKNPAALKTIGNLPHSDVDLAPTVDNIAGDTLVSTIKHEVEGSFSKNNVNLEAITGLVKSSIMGTITGARDILAGQFLGLASMSPSQAVRVMSIYKDMPKNIAESFAAGVNRSNVGTFEQFARDGGDVVNILGTARDILNTVQGRSYMETIARATAFGQGKFLALDNVIVAQKALQNGQAIPKHVSRFMDLFGTPAWKEWAKAGQIPAEELERVAARYTNSVQQSYDLRDLPNLAIEGQLVPLLSLSRWSLGKLNTFSKVALQPALEGDILPLMMTLGGSMLGGSAVLLMTEAVTGRQQRMPSIAELTKAAESRPLITLADDVMYKFMGTVSAAGYLGFLGDIMYGVTTSIIGDNPFEVAQSPLFNFIGDNTGLALDAAEAFANGEFNIGLDIFNEFMIKNAQGYRLLAGLVSEARQDTIERSNDFRDLAVFDRLEGLQVSNNRIDYNPFLGLDKRKFRREQDPKKAAQMGREIIQDLYRKYGNNPMRLQQELRSLNTTSAPAFPNSEIDPARSSKFYNFLSDTQGEQEARERLADANRVRALNKFKSRLVPEG